MLHQLLSTENGLDIFFTAQFRYWNYHIRRERCTSIKMINAFASYSIHAIVQEQTLASQQEGLR